jgi:hypothetical protein
MRLDANSIYKRRATLGRPLAQVYSLFARFGHILRRNHLPCNDLGMVYSISRFVFTCASEMSHFPEVDWPCWLTRDGKSGVPVNQTPVLVLVLLLISEVRRDAHAPPAQALQLVKELRPGQPLTSP